MRPMRTKSLRLGAACGAALIALAAAGPAAAVPAAQAPQTLSRAALADGAPRAGVARSAALAPLAAPAADSVDRPPAETGDDGSLRIGPLLLALLGLVLLLGLRTRRRDD